MQFRPFEAELRATGLPYVVVGGMSFFDRKEVRDVVAYLKLAVNPRDETSLLRVINTPPRGRGQGQHRQGPGLRHRPRHLRERGLRAGGRDRGALARSPSRATGRCARPLDARGPGRGGHASRRPRSRRFLDAVDYRDEVTRLYPDPMTREARWAGVEEILNFAENHVRRSAEPSLHGFLEELALTSGDEPEEKPETRGDAVTLMTLHAAKGLEFPHVFLVGMEEGLLPHARAVAEGGVEEERRLAYVGITRAMTHADPELGLRAREVRPPRAVRALALPVRGAGRGAAEGWVGVEASVRPEGDELARRPREEEGRPRTGRGRQGRPAQATVALRRLASVLDPERALHRHATGCGAGACSASACAQAAGRPSRTAKRFSCG